MAKTMNSTNTNNGHISSSDSLGLGVCEKLFAAIKTSLIRPRVPLPRLVSKTVISPSDDEETIPGHVSKVVPIEWTVDKRPEIRIDRDDRLNEACEEFINRARAKIKAVDHHRDEIGKSDGGDGAIKKKESFKVNIIKRSPKNVAIND